MKRNEFITVSILILSGILLYILACNIMGYSIFRNQKVANSNSPIVSGHEGEQLPSIEILLPDSSTHINVRDVNNKPIVLFFFGPDCPFCHQQMTEIIQSIEKLNQVDFILITTYPFNDMRRFYDSFHLARYQNIQIGLDFKFAFTKYFQTQKIPYMVVYDKNKILKEAYIGVITYNQIIESLN